MKTIRRIFILAIAMFMNYSMTAQSTQSMTANVVGYKTAVGLRAGEMSGITFKRFSGQNHALEFIVGDWPYGFRATGLYEKYSGSAIAGLNWYYGGGAHFGFETGRVYYYYPYYDRYYNYYYRTSGNMALGIDGIIGIEYKIKPIPFAVSLDMKPFTEINSFGDIFFGLDPGLGIKVVF
ncbi:MAG: hypothetical protein HY064_08495 [Bacteroidetes bacterium]|nr:hypothetical protein [Bacteroidota bacterium]